MNNKNWENKVKEIIKEYVGINKISEGIAKDILKEIAVNAMSVIELIAEPETAETFRKTVKKDEMERLIKDVVKQALKKEKSPIYLDFSEILTATKNIKITEFSFVINNVIRTTDVVKTVQIRVKKQNEEKLLDVLQGEELWISLFYLYIFLYDCIFVEYYYLFNQMKEFIEIITKEILPDMSFITALTHAMKKVLMEKPEMYEVIAEKLDNKKQNNIETLLNKLKCLSFMEKTYKILTIDLMNAFVEVFCEKLNIEKDFALPMHQISLPEDTIIDKMFLIVDKKINKSTILVEIKNLRFLSFALQGRLFWEVAFATMSYFMDRLAEKAIETAKIKEKEINPVNIKPIKPIKWENWQLN